MKALKRLSSISVASVLGLSILTLSGCAYLSKSDSNKHWGYSGKEGPENWGKLADDFSVCETGVNQSPINIDKTIEARLTPLSLKYGQAASEITNNGHTVQLNFPADSGFILDEHPYELKQVHFHSPSENTIAGKSYPLDAHFVHADSNGHLAVIGVFFEEGEENSAIAKAWQQLPTNAGEKKALVEQIYPRAMMPSEGDYYRFSGSLTTPPCSEGVLWLVLKEPITASKEQIQAFQNAVGHANNRPVQPVNARAILR